MKPLLKLFVLFFGVSFLFTGCYTIVWDPSQELPSEETYSDDNGFYETEYYGGYGSYYETPWWVGAPTYIMSPGTLIDKNTTKERNSDRTSGTENIRNVDGRGNTDRDAGITTPVPTTTKSSSGSTSKTTSTTKDSGSDNNRSSNSSNTTSSSSSDSGRSSSGSDTRNNSGSRNSDSGRR